MEVLKISVTKEQNKGVSDGRRMTDVTVQVPVSQSNHRHQDINIIFSSEILEDIPSRAQEQNRNRQGLLWLS